MRRSFLFLLLVLSDSNEKLGKLYEIKGKETQDELALEVNGSYLEVHKVGPIKIEVEEKDNSALNSRSGNLIKSQERRIG